MNRFPEPLIRLIQTLGQLPGVGPRSAERMALDILKWGDGKVENFTSDILEHARSIGTCSACGCFTVHNECRNCEASATTSPSSPGKIICVVEKPTDTVSLERFHAFEGVFHVLGGKISPTQGVDPEDLLIHSLIDRILQLSPNEIIFGLMSDIESEATIHYIRDRIRGTDGIEDALKLTRLAQGMPAGSSLEFTDGVTLSQALDNRTPI